MHSQDQLISALGLAAFAPLGGPWYRPVRPLPEALLARMPQLDGDRVDLAAELPYLAQFLGEAKAVWSGGEVRSVRSGEWTQDDREQRPCHLEAIAVRTPERRLVLLALADRAHEQLHAILQTARESSLEFEQSEREHTAALIETNARLQAEIAERRRVHARLVAYQDELRQLTEAVTRAEHRERNRLAALLHDGIGQNLALAKLQIGWLGQSAAGAEQGDRLATVRDLLDETIALTRDLTAELAPPLLHELGLEAALQSLVERVGARDRIHTDYGDDGTAKPLQPATRSLVFQAVREVLHNVVKHAGASRAGVRTWRADERLWVTVEDDGEGFDPDAPRRGGFGLFSVRERIETAGGQLEIDSQPGAGTRITIHVPLSD